MNEVLIYVILAFTCLGIGYFLGNYIQKLKITSIQSTLVEREQQLRTHISSLEEQLARVQREQNELRVATEADKNQLRSEKVHLGNQIVRYQADLEKLQLKNREQKEEVEKV